MNSPEQHSPPFASPEHKPHQVVLTNYDRIIADEGKFTGWERSAAEYEQKGLKGLAKKLKYSFLRQSLIRSHIKEAQKQVKSNTKELLLKSSDVEAAAKDLDLKNKPYIRPEEVEAYREGIGLDDTHAERIDDQYDAQRKLLEDQLQLMITDIAKSGKRDRIALEVSNWVDGAITQLPKYYRREDKDLFVQQITQSVNKVLDSYATAVSEKEENVEDKLKIDLHLAGVAKNGGRSKASVMLEEITAHPLIWTGASIAAKAMLFAPVVGGVLGGLRKRIRVEEDLSQMQMERVHGRKGKDDKYRRELAGTFLEQLKASDYITRFESILSSTKVDDVKSVDAKQVDNLITLVSSLRAIRKLKLQTISYTQGQMQRENIALLKLESEASRRLEKWGQGHRISHQVGRDVAELRTLHAQQEKNQRKLKNKKALIGGATVAGISLATMGLAAAMPDEWTEAVVNKIGGGAKQAWEHARPVAEAIPTEPIMDGISNVAASVSEVIPGEQVQAAAANTIDGADAAFNRINPVVDETHQSAEGANDRIIVGDGTGGPEYDSSMLEAPTTESHSLWQELISQQDQRDTSNDSYIAYGTPEWGEYNELELKYETNGDGDFIINVSGMEPNADGIDGNEFPENEQLYAVFYLTDADKEMGNEIRIPIPENGQLVINEDTYPQLMPLFENSNGEVEQQFAVLGIASQNEDGSYTFYASNWDHDISAHTIEAMKQAEVIEEGYQVSPPNEQDSTVGNAAVPGGNSEVDEHGNEIVDVVVPEDEAEVDAHGNPIVTIPAPEDGAEVDANGNPIVNVGTPPEYTPPPTVEPPTPAAEPNVESDYNLVGGYALDQRGMMSGTQRLREAKAGVVDPPKPENLPPGLSNLIKDKRFVEMSPAVLQELITHLEKVGDKSVSAEKFIAEHKDTLQYMALVGDQVYVLTSNHNGTILALTFDQTKPSEVKTRLWRVSGSDNQWKAIPGFRQNGVEFLKGDEDNVNNHYVQSAKLHPDVYEVLNQASGKKVDSAAAVNLTEYLPIKGGRFNSELDFKESHIVLKNQEWWDYQQKARFAYAAYEMFILNNASNIDFTADKNPYKEALDRIEEANKNGNAESSYHQLDPFIQEYQKLENEISNLMTGTPDQVKEANELEAALKSIDMSQTGHPNPRIAKLVETYNQSVGNFIERVASRLKAPDSMTPKFDESEIKQRYFKPNPPGQKDKGISIEEYEVISPEGDTLRWAMARDSDGRVYIDNIYDPRVGATNYGTQAKIVNMGFLVYKPEDYEKQTIGIPDKYKDNPDGGYVSISRLWSENVPIIKEYKAALDSRNPSPPPVDKRINPMGGVGDKMYGPPPPLNDLEDENKDKEAEASPAGAQKGPESGNGFGSGPVGSSGINSENNTNGSGNILYGNNSTQTINNGLNGEQQIQSQQIEFEKDKMHTEDRNRERNSRDQSESRQYDDRKDERSTTQDDRQHERTESNVDRDRERQANLERERIASEERQATSESSTQAQVRSLEIISDIVKTMSERSRSQNENSTQREAESNSELKVQAESMQSIAESLVLMRTSMERMIENSATQERNTQADASTQIVVDGMLAAMDRSNQTLGMMMEQFKTQLPQLEQSADLQARISALENAQQAEQQSIKTEQTTSLAERINRLRERRRQPRINPRQINRAQGRAPKDLYGNPAERPDGPVVGNFAAPGVAERRITNASEKQKSDFLNYHSSGEYRKNSVKSIRDKVYAELKQLYPERYTELREKAKQKIDTELLNPWQRGENTPESRREWLEQLYDQNFYTELAGDNASTDMGDRQANNQPKNETVSDIESGSESTAEARPEYPVKLEDMDDRESGRRATEFASREEYEESQAGRQNAERLRQRRENRDQRRREASEQAQTGSVRTQSATQSNTVSRPIEQVEQTESVDPRAESRANQLQRDFPDSKVNLRERIDREPYGLIAALANKRSLNNEEKVRLTRTLQRQVGDTARASNIVIPDYPALRSEMDKAIESLIEKWSTQEQTPRERINEARAIYSGVLLNELIDRLSRNQNVQETSIPTNTEEKENSIEDGPFNEPEAVVVEDANETEAEPQIDANTGVEVTEVLPNNEQIENNLTEEEESGRRSGRNNARTNRDESRRNRERREIKEVMGLPTGESSEEENQRKADEELNLAREMVRGMTDEQARELIDVVYNNLSAGEREDLINRIKEANG